jgi:hypothetical protein
LDCGGKKWQETGEDYVMRSFITCLLHQIFLARRTRCSGHVTHVGGDEKCIQLESLKGRDDAEDLGIDGNIILEWILGKYVGKVWTGFICFRIGIGGGLL